MLFVNSGKYLLLITPVLNLSHFPNTVLKLKQKKSGKKKESYQKTEYIIKPYILAKFQRFLVLIFNPKNGIYLTYCVLRFFVFTPYFSRTLGLICIVLFFFVDLPTDCKVMQSGALFENV